MDEERDRLGLRASDERSSSRLIPLCSYLQVPELMDYLQSPEFQPISSDETTGAPVPPDELLKVFLPDEHDQSTCIHALAQRRSFSSVFACLEFLSILSNVPGVPSLVNATDAMGHTPLHLAATLNNIFPLHAFLKWGADLDTRDHRGMTALDIGCLLGHIDIVKVLLEASSPGLDCQRLMLLAASHSDVIALLQEHQRKAVQTVPAIGGVRNREEEEKTQSAVFRRASDEDLRNSIRVVKKHRARVM